MCITLTLSYSGCGHQESYIRSCKRDGSLCGSMVTTREWQSGENFQASAICRDCFMLPDPRESLLPEARSESMIDWYAYRYPIWNVEAETHALQVRSRDLPLPRGPFELSNFHTANTVVFEPLSMTSIEELDGVLNQHLLPDFWLRAARGERSSAASRISCLRLRQIFLLNLALRHSESKLGRDTWCIAMGFSGQRLVPEISNREEDCGICRESLRAVSEQGIPVRTPCHHIFHRSCIETWLQNSVHGNCPSCRRGIRSIAPSLDLLGTNPEWLRALTAFGPLSVSHVLLETLAERAHMAEPTTPSAAPYAHVTRNPTQETVRLIVQLEQARLARKSAMEIVQSINTDLRGLERKLFFSLDRDFVFIRLFRLDADADIISQQLAGYRVRHRRRQIFFASCDVERRRLIRCRVAAERLVNQAEDRYFRISRDLASARLAALESFALSLQNSSEIE